MIQEDKELLLRDLCARLPYGVNILYDGRETREMGLGSLHDFMFNDVAIKPYLRPMSSMTEEERKYYNQLSLLIADGDANAYEEIDWLNAHHFDYRGLIEKGLAIEITKDNNPYE